MLTQSHADPALDVDEAIVVRHLGAAGELTTMPADDDQLETDAAAQVDEGLPNAYWQWHILQ